MGTEVETAKRAKGGRPRLTDAGRIQSENRRRNLNLTLGRHRTASANSIGKIPKCKNPKRRAEAEKHLRAWIETYLLSLFSNPKTGEHYPWSKSQIDLMNLLNEALHEQKRIAGAIPRGGFKSGLGKAGAIYGTLKGLQGWSCIVGATTDASRKKTLKSIKTVLETNKLLAEDYPEVCVPIRALEGETIKTKRQTYTLKGKEISTRMEWSAERIIFPNIEGSKSRQAILTAIGLTASEIRGQVMSLADGTERRPTNFFFDDVETDESAGSDLQVPQRFALVKAALFSGGPGAPLSAFYAGTVIEENCVCVRIMESDDWDSVKRPAMPKMPLHCAETPPEIAHEDFWDEYHKLLKIKPVSEARERANRFYAANRKEMDEGAEVDWLYRKDPWELSAIQHCMNVYLSEPEFFWSEYQQSPRRHQERGIRVTPQLILSRTNGRPQWEVPADAVIVTVGIDVNKNILPFVVSAFAPDFTGSVIGYGTWPQQPRSNWSKINPPHPLRLDYLNTSMDSDGIIQAGLGSLIEWLKRREFKTATGREFQIGKLLCDGRYGTKLVFAALKRAGMGSAAEVSMGIGRTANRLPVAKWDRNKKDANGHRWSIGEDWYRKPVQGTNEAPHVSIVVDSWKTFLHNGFSLLPGTRGSMQIFGTPSQAYLHELFVNHLGNSESPEDGRDSYRNDMTTWKVIPGASENDYFDAAVLSVVAASVSGMCKPPVEASEKPDEGPTRRIVRASPIGQRYDSVYS